MEKKWGAIIAISSLLTACSSYQSAPPFQLSSTSTTSTGANGNSPYAAIPAPTSAAMYSKSAFASSGLRRLSVSEISNSLVDIFGLIPDASQLPLDSVASSEELNVFDNDFTLQKSAQLFVENLHAMSEKYSQQIAANTSKVNQIAGCTPSGPGDTACFQKFAAKVGALLFRRPVSTTELANFKPFTDFAQSEGNFYLGIELLLQTLINHPEFIYRLENSGTAGNLVALNNYQIAARMSFFIWGSGPDSALLADAGSGRLTDTKVREAHATRMFADGRARRQWMNFHAQWLGFSRLTGPSPALDKDMRQETQALIDRVTYAKNEPWFNLFRAKESYLTPALASHYGMSVAQTGWTPYTQTGRGGGILSHGLFAALGSKFGDTSPTLRGYKIIKHLFCRGLGTVPAGVNTDVAPSAGGLNACKTTRYFMRNTSSCVQCHGQTDNIGFGLENLDSEGTWRSAEYGNSACNIDGQGEFYGETFKGPAGLGELLARSSEMEACSVKQLFRFANGRPDGSNDEAVIAAMHRQLLDTPDLKSLILSIVKSDGFINRGGNFL